MRVTDREWLRRGVQKKTLAQVLRKPMTGSELLTAMRRENCSKAQLRDLWRLLQKFEQRGLIICLTPGEPAGRVFFLTDRGRRAVKLAFGQSVAPLSTGVDWKKYAQVARGRVRQIVLSEVGRNWIDTLARKTAAAIRKKLRDKHPMGLGATIRALRELERLKLIRRAGVTAKRACPFYELTKTGRFILEQLLEKRADSEAFGHKLF
jgi:DNA-binding PadR family transcriptional regulator